MSAPSIKRHFGQSPAEKPCFRRWTFLGKRTEGSALLKRRANLVPGWAQGERLLPRPAKDTGGTDPPIKLKPLVRNSKLPLLPPLRPLRRDLQRYLLIPLPQLQRLKPLPQRHRPHPPLRLRRLHPSRGFKNPQGVQGSSSTLTTRISMR